MFCCYHFHLCLRRLYVAWLLFNHVFKPSNLLLEGCQTPTIWTWTWRKVVLFCWPNDGFPYTRDIPMCVPPLTSVLFRLCVLWRRWWHIGYAPPWFYHSFRISCPCPSSLPSRACVSGGCCFQRQCLHGPEAWTEWIFIMSSLSMLRLLLADILPARPSSILLPLISVFLQFNCYPSYLLWTRSSWHDSLH